MSNVLEQLRRTSVPDRVGALSKPSDEAVLEEWDRSGVRFAASSPKFEAVYYSAVRKLLDCIVPTAAKDGSSKPILHEGGIYLGCWLESTGTINAELLSRFVPSVAEASFGMFADYQLEDGQLPYKITGQGAAYRQIQMVTPLARSVWNHYALNGRNRTFLRTMYDAMARFDAWLATYRDTRGTGGVEAFAAFDTGHDLSPRFWHVPDTPHGNDARYCNPDSPILPFVAPDLTANVVCQRGYFARMAEELGEAGAPWRDKAQQSLASLYAQCYDEADAFFYDRDRNGQLVRVQSDVLLRVLACEIGDRAFFDGMLKRYLLNTRKFFAKYPFTSLAMDDPRFDPFSSYNTWAGATNFLSLIRAPHAFEHHGKYVELTWVMYPLMAAFNKMERFGQCLSPWTGEEGYTETYSPAILCLLDFVERLCGIVPTPEGQLWFTGLLPYAVDHGEDIASETAYSRTVDGARYELANSPAQSAVYRDGELHATFPHGTRLVTDRAGRVQALVGMTVRTVEGTVRYDGADYRVAVKGNETLAFADGAFVRKDDPGVVPPGYA